MTIDQISEAWTDDERLRVIREILPAANRCLRRGRVGDAVMLIEVANLTATIDAQSLNVNRGGIADAMDSAARINNANPF